MSVVVISDLHIGAVHCNRSALAAFFDGLADEDALVLNGDVYDSYAKGLTDADRGLVVRIANEAGRRPVTWVEGNHDRRVGSVVPRGVEYRRSMELPGGILVAHGDGFNGFLHVGRPVTRSLRWAYHVRSLIVGDHEDVAAYAKRWPMLYSIIRKSVRRGAIVHARGHGFKTVICGHSHYPEDTTLDGVRFINTGAWTESPVYCVRVTDASISFEQAG